VSGLSVLAVDNERPALDDLARVLRASPQVARVERALDGRQALLKLNQHSFDALFLDVRMPGLDGIELARVLRRFARPPAVVFVSAYETAAVAAFEVRALDYVMKPVGQQRIEEALTRVAESLRDASAAGAAAASSAPALASAPAAAGSDVVPVDQLRGRGTRLLARSSILYLQTHGEYVRVYAEDGRYLLRARLGELQRRWEPHGFVRVHRAYLVNLRRAVEVRAHLNGTASILFPDGSAVPIARRQVPELRRRLDG
jgi:DNA-binding LytR/AlgR family response regulator